jgi:hypothetical protein
MSNALSVSAFVVRVWTIASPPQLPIISVSEVAGVLLECGMTTFKSSLKLWVEISPSPPKYVGWDWNRGCAVKNMP